MSPSSRRRLVDCASEGEPPKKVVGCVETIKFIIYDFKKKEAGKSVSSPILKAHGRKWKIKCSPGDANDTDSYFQCFLQYLGTSEMACQYSVRSTNYSTAKGRRLLQPKEERSWKTFCQQSKIAEECEDDGSLVLEADIQKTVAAQDCRIVWYPPEFQRQEILVDLYQDAYSETADVIFSVGNYEYKAHKSILSLRCKKLYEIAKDCDSNQPIPLDSPTENIFEQILDFVYTVKLPSIKNIDTASQLLIAADRYECVKLKLYVESIIVDKFLTPENTAEMLLLADSYSCALLKEAATNKFATNAAIVKTTEAWSKIKESRRLLIELLETITPSVEPKVQDLSSRIDRLDVGTLRTKLENNNLELDGSREVIVERWKNFCQNQKTKKENGNNENRDDDHNQN